MRSEYRYVHAGAGLGAALLAFSCLALAQQPPTPVAVGEVVERDIPASIKLVGTVYPEREAVVAAEVEGLVAELPISEGQLVKQGDVLCVVDQEIATFALAEARARLEGLREQLKELEAGTREERLRELEAAMREAEAVRDKWDFERKRISGLFERGQTSDKELHDAEMDFSAAQQRLTAAKAAYETAVNGPRAEEIARARYGVSAQQAVVQRLERNLKQTRTCAPFDGFVVAKRTEIGEWIDAGGAVCEMVALDTVKVRADVPEHVVSFARAESPATVFIDALGQSFEARVSRVIPRAAEEARTFPVEVDLANKDYKLLAGMFAWVHVPSGPPGKRLMVPKDAIVARGLDKQIFVVRPGPDGGQMAMPLAVTTGLEITGEIEVSAPGLQAGDKVVTRANERLYGPSPVIVRGAGQTPPSTTRNSDQADHDASGAETQD